MPALSFAVHITLVAFGISFPAIGHVVADCDVAQGARDELHATGRTVHNRTLETRDDLTAQERQVALMARGGLSNLDIAARLFLSPRTVAWHVRKVFMKLGIRSRRELTNALAGADFPLSRA